MYDVMLDRTLTRARRPMRRGAPSTDQTMLEEARADLTPGASSTVVL